MSSDEFTLGQPTSARQARTESYALVAREVSVTYSTLRHSGDTRAKNPIGRLGVLPSRTTKKAVKRASLAIGKGEAVGLIGRNGSGKSTLMRAFAGLEMITGGEVYASSQPLLLSVSPALLSERTGRENIYLGCLAMGMSPREARQTIPKVVELADIGSAIDDPIGTYSSGMGARLRFAISAVPRNTEILLIDEGLGAGDAAFKQRSEGAMQRILDRAGTIVMVSHSPRSIARMCNRVIWMVDGEVVADGPAKEVSAAYSEWTRLVSARTGDLAAGFLNEVRADYLAPLIRFIEN